MADTVERSDHIEIQLLAESGEWVGHETCEDEAVGHAEVASLTRMYGEVVQFRLVHRWTEIEVLTPPLVTASRTDKQPHPDVLSPTAPLSLGRAMTDTEQELLDAEHDDLCPACRGSGEIVDCPRSCDGSHRADVPYVCRDCSGTGER